MKKHYLPEQKRNKYHGYGMRRGLDVGGGNVTQKCFKRILYKRKKRVHQRTRWKEHLQKRIMMMSEKAEWGLGRGKRLSMVQKCRRVCVLEFYISKYYHQYQCEAKTGQWVGRQCCLSYM